MAVKVLGYQVTTHAQPESAETRLSGFAQARRELAHRNGDGHPIGYALNTDSHQVIDSRRLDDPEALWNQDGFDSGVCTCAWPKQTRFHDDSLLWTKK